MDSLTWEEQFDKVLSNCKWREVVDGIPISRAKRLLQRALYSTITILGIDLKRSKDGLYLIRAFNPETKKIEYLELELEDWEKYIREMSFITGLENYPIRREIIEFVLSQVYQRKEVI